LANLLEIGNVPVEQSIDEIEHSGARLLLLLLAVRRR
jgi:hypothetical protein